jgi:hypothetical protein
MRKKIILFLLLAAFLAASVAPAFAQARGAFSIICNVTGAKVYLNGELAGYTKPTFSALLKPGAYRVRVTMEKYQPFETVINMTINPLNLPVKLVPEGAVSQPPPRFNLTVTANVAGAQVFVNNAPVGTVPLSMQVDRGNFSVRVSAPGYQDFQTTVTMAGNATVNAVLQGLPPRLLQLAVNCNVNGAQIYVNNALAGTAPFVGSYPPGSYTVRASAPGFADASAVVNLNRNEAVSLVLQGLQPRLLQLAVNCNVNGAQVYVNNSLAGTAPFVGSYPPGSYAVRASAPGFADATAVVNLNNRNETVNLVLQGKPGRLLQLAVNCNVPGAQIYINYALAGTAPFIGAYPAGSYTVQASAPGYSDASAVVNLNKNETVNLVLQPSFASVQVVIPPDFLEFRGKGPREQLRLFVDGQPYDSPSFSLPAGTHNLRLATGGFSFAADFEFEAGRSYVLEPMFSWTER